MGDDGFFHGIASNESLFPISFLVATKASRSVRQKQRKFQQASQCLEEFRARGAVDNSMITTHCDTEPAPYHDISTDDYRFWLNAAYREDSTLRWIDDRGEVIDAE